jgi:hypothetical protein
MTRHQSNEATQIAPTDAAAVTAARIAAMLDRWEEEDVSDEPDWDLADLEPTALHAIPPVRPGTGTP